MIQVILEDKDSSDALIRKYKRKLDKIGFNRRYGRPQFFVKKSTRRKLEVQRAVLRQRYLQKNGLL